MSKLTFHPPLPLPIAGGCPEYKTTSTSMYKSGVEAMNRVPQAISFTTSTCPDVSVVKDIAGGRSRLDRNVGYTSNCKR